MPARMGIAQFMPTTLAGLCPQRRGRRTAVIDLFTHADAMASIANFLKRLRMETRNRSQKKAFKTIIYRITITAIIT